MNHLTRALYLFAMYSGLRALFNQLRSYTLPKPRASVIAGETLQLGDGHSIKVCVHARTPSSLLPPDQIAGMVSIYSIDPSIPRFSYAMLRLTSHFGCGEIEIAFFEEKGSVTLFAIRNILKSNLDRCGTHRLCSQLKLCNTHDEIRVLRTVIESLCNRGINASFASPEECVSLSVNESLLNPKTRNRTLKVLTQKYRRIGNRLAAVHP
ncbi:MAG: hypothetical protein P8L85_17350 [Rubripirellula sp.]|nr:hypothetical protein [Rubripirellula sp.]